MSQSTLVTSSAAQSQSSVIPAATRPLTPFAKYDDRIGAVCDRILPKQPYLLTIPSNLPYRRHTSDPNRWFLDTPFHRKEEQLQYMSLLLHQADDEPLLKVDGTRIDIDGHLLPAMASPQSEAPSRPQTPSEAGPKKKISLADYKSKDRSGVNTPERRPVDDIRKQAIKSHKEEVQAKREQVDVQSKPANKSATKPAISSPIAPATKSEAKSKPKLSSATPTRIDQDSLRPAKKRRLSEEPALKSTNAASKIIERSSAPSLDKRNLPDLLSPDLPLQAKKKAKLRELPSLLSPKLPELLEKAARSPLPRSDEVKDILKSAAGLPGKTSDKKAVESSVKDVAGRVRSESQLSARSSTPNIKISSPQSRPAAASSRPSTPLTNGRTASPRRQRHIIVLKYGKRNRKRVEMLLKMSARPRKDISIAAERETQTGPKIGIKQEAVHTDKKRPSEVSEETSSRKPKMAAASSSLEVPVKLERPSTPKPSVLEKHKPSFSTPKKDSKSVLMTRDPSTDTLDAGTPSQEPHRTSTPNPTTQSSMSKASPAPTSAPSKGDETWSSFGERIYALGKILKREGQRLSSEVTSKEKQQGVVVLIEGLLCFMLHSAALAQARPNADPGWSTIVPYLNMTLKQSRPFKHLSGLVWQLNAVCRQYLQHEQLRRLAKETGPDDHIGSAPTPGSDGNSRSVDENPRKQKFSDLRDEIVHNSKALRSAWLEGGRILPNDILERDYTSTWRKKLQDMSKRNPDELNSKDLPKDFTLPMDPTTNAFEATNFALAFLWEWTLIEQVNWKSRIEL